MNPISPARLTAAAAVAGLLLAPGAQALMVDTFDDAAFQFVHTGVQPGPVTTASANALGGWRTLWATASGPGATQAYVYYGAYNHGQSAGTPGTSTVLWDAAGGGLGGVDLTEGGVSDHFALEVRSRDAGDLSLAVTVTDTHGATAQVNHDAFSTGTLWTPFAEFAGVDLTRVERIALQVTAGAAVDLSLDHFATASGIPDLAPAAVPLPPSVALLSAALALLAGVGRGRP